MFKKITLLLSLWVCGREACPHDSINDDGPSYVYILASQRSGTLYMGATLDLIKRTWEHRNKFIPGFTAKYNVHMLVNYETHALYVEAARREKRFKNWPRQWKLNLIEKLNPEWRELYEEICQ